MSWAGLCLLLLCWLQAYQAAERKAICDHIVGQLHCNATGGQYVRFIDTVQRKMYAGVGHTMQWLRCAIPLWFRSWTPLAVPVSQQLGAPNCTTEGRYASHVPLSPRAQSAWGQHRTRRVHSARAPRGCLATATGKLLCCRLDLSSRAGYLCGCTSLGRRATTGQGPFQRLRSGCRLYCAPDCATAVARSGGYASFCGQSICSPFW